MRAGTTTRAEWEEMKAKGRTRFLLLFGVLGRGVPMAVAFLMVFLYLEGRPFDVTLLRDPSVWLRLLLPAALFSVGGVASAYARWRAIEMRFETPD